MIDNQFILSKPVGTSHLNETKMDSAVPKGLRILIYHRENRHLHLSFFGVKVAKSGTLIVKFFCRRMSLARKIQGRDIEGILSGQQVLFSVAYRQKTGVIW